MARRNTALMVVPPRLSPERRKLAEAIEQHRIATEEFDATNTALSRAEEGRYEARTRLEEAEAVVESAAQANADHAVDMAMGRRKKPPLTPQAAAQARRVTIWRRRATRSPRCRRGSGRPRQMFRGNDIWCMRRSRRS
jgi:hypothetical protein